MGEAAMTGCPFVSTVEELSRQQLDCLIIGSGPAGTAVAEQLYTESSNLRIGILERGPLLTTSHISNVLRPSLDGPDLSEPTLRRDQARGQFIERHEVKPWTGAFKDDGMLIMAFGGRGIVAGAHLPRFYEDDLAGYGLDEDARWPISRKLLERYYQKAEGRRHVSFGECKGQMQTWALCQLQKRNAHEPPWGVDVRSGTNTDISLGYDSAASRLWDLLVRDDAQAGGDLRKRRLFLATNAYAHRLMMSNNGKTVRAVACYDTRYAPPEAPLRPTAIELTKFRTVVLAASTIESARLALLSGLGDPPSTPESERVVGHYLAEHIFVRSALFRPILSANPHDQFINVVVPPRSAEAVNRFHIHVVGGPSTQPEHAGEVMIRITGEAAMDPAQENYVRLNREGDPDGVDGWGVPKAHIVFSLGECDRNRIGHMISEMRAVASALGGTLPEKIEPLPPGRSHHEGGTLRMGTDPEHSVVNPEGRFHGVRNLFAADASVFPCVGVANPMLTITAMGYHVAASIERALAAEAVEAVQIVANDNVRSSVHDVTVQVGETEAA
jgi:choline dehydrogenase-like flavoprotein